MVGSGIKRGYLRTRRWNISAERCRNNDPALSLWQSRLLRWRSPLNSIFVPYSQLGQCLWRNHLPDVDHNRVICAQSRVTGEQSTNPVASMPRRPEPGTAAMSAMGQLRLTTFVERSNDGTSRPRACSTRPGWTSARAIVDRGLLVRSAHVVRGLIDGVVQFSATRPGRDHGCRKSKLVCRCVCT
jgi:hypothetical protein